MILSGFRGEVTFNCSKSHAVSGQHGFARAAFSFIELLVVIAILLGLRLPPTLGLVREAATGNSGEIAR